MPTKEEISRINRESARRNVTHRVNAFETRGEAALQPHQKEYLIELRERVRTHPGRMEVREELTAALFLIVQMGFSRLQQEAEEEKDIWQAGVIRVLATYINSLRLLLDNWPDDRDVIDITDILKQGKDNSDEEATNDSG